MAGGGRWRIKVVSNEAEEVGRGPHITFVLVRCITNHSQM